MLKQEIIDKNIGFDELNIDELINSLKMFFNIQLKTQKLTIKQLETKTEQLNQTNEQLKKIIYNEIYETIGKIYKMKRTNDEEMKEEFKIEITKKIKEINEIIIKEDEESAIYIETIGMLLNKEKQKQLYYQKNELDYQEKNITKEEYEKRSEQTKKYDVDIFEYLQQTFFNKIIEQDKLKIYYERYLKIELSLNIVFSKFLKQNRTKPLTNKQQIYLKEIQKEIELFKQQKNINLSEKQENEIIIKLLLNHNLSFNNNLSIDTLNKYVKSYLSKYSNLTKNKSDILFHSTFNPFDS